MIKVKIIRRHLGEIVWLVQNLSSLRQTILLQSQRCIQSIHIELHIALHGRLGKEVFRGKSQIFLCRIQPVELQISLSEISINNSRRQGLFHLPCSLLSLQEAFQSLSRFFLTAVHISPTVVKEMNIFRILWRIQAFSLLEIMMRQLIVLQIIINLSQS